MNERINTMNPCPDPKACAVRAAADPKLLTLAILFSASLLVQCAVAALETAVSRNNSLLLCYVLSALVCVLTCAGLWTLVLQGRAGHMTRAGFALARVVPIVVGVMLQIVAVMLLAASVLLQFFRPMMMDVLSVYTDTMNQYFQTYFGTDFNTLADAMLDIAAAVAAVAFVVEEVFALRSLLLARFVRKMRILATEGQAPRFSGGFVEVVSYVLGAGIVLAGAVDLAMSVAGGDWVDIGTGIGMVLNGLCAFCTGLVVGAAGHHIAAARNAVAPAQRDARSSDLRFGEAIPNEKNMY